MIYQTKIALLLSAATCAALLFVDSGVQAGSPWGWKKPVNQKLGAFYTSNKAFKRKQSTSANRGHSFHRRHAIIHPYHGRPSAITVAPRRVNTAVPWHGHSVPAPKSSSTSKESWATPLWVRPPFDGPSFHRHHKK